MLRPVREKVENNDVTGFPNTITLFNIPTTMSANSIKLLTGNSYPELARLVADRYV